MTTPDHLLAKEWQERQAFDAKRELRSARSDQCACGATGLASGGSGET